MVIMNEPYTTTDAENQAAWDAFCAEFLLETIPEPIFSPEFSDPSPTSIPDSAEAE